MSILNSLKNISIDLYINWKIKKGCKGWQKPACIKNKICLDANSKGQLYKL